ncbi:MAG: 4Fe-4S binding protein [Anaerolineae bacterium]|nr:4Fe-4S binding protein [Anaerolineae bacterium]
MKLGAMLNEVTVSLFRRPSTRRYPAECVPAPQRLRGLVRWHGDKCTGCGLCGKDCPANAIEVVTLDKANKRFVMVYDVDRCAFCAQCVHSCRQGCLEMADDQWELAALSREPLCIFYGAEADVEHVLADRAAAGAGEAADG